jgi:hypothetical protein
MPHDLVRLCRKCLLLILLGPSLFALAAPVHAAGNGETVAGYLLVSAGRSISPVKACSLVSDFTALPE